MTIRTIGLASLGLIIAGAALVEVARHGNKPPSSDSPLTKAGPGPDSGLVNPVLAENQAADKSPITPPSTPKDARISYNRDILPIFANNCFLCHGPDPEARKAGLRLDLRDLAIKPAKSGDVPIKPGHAAESEVVQRLITQEAAQRMPPPKSGKSLTLAEKELIQRWIDQGAEYQGHWSFSKPSRPPLPEVQDKGWGRNEIDAFILARLEQARLKPSPPADRPTLIRRLSLDLRGLPPSLAEVDEFLRDPAPDAYENLVDRMLASPRHGEKMALAWLDLARFGDTSGFHQDSTRQMWLWRDWVIKAFNKNMPFDRFTVEQLAGDLLPGATLDQKIASGFNRNTRFNEEGGADPEEFVIRYNVDRTNTLGQVWLGMTLGCAECHAHKYDPISQKEFYQLYAYFTGIAEPMVSMNHNLPLPPLLKVPQPEQAKKLEALKAEEATIQFQIQRELKLIKYQDPHLANSGPLKPQDEAEDLIWVDDDAPAGAKLESIPPHAWRWGTAPKHQVLSGKKSMLRSGPGVHQHFFHGAARPLDIHAGDKLFTYVWLDPKNPPKTVMLQWHDGVWDHRAYWGGDHALQAGTPEGPQHHHAGPLPKLGEWARLEVNVEKVGLKPGARVGGWAFVVADGAAFFDKAGIHTRHPLDDRFLESQSVWERQEQTSPGLPADIKASLKIESGKRSEEQKKLLRDYYLRKVWISAQDTFEPLDKELEQINKQIKAIEDVIPYTMVSEEMAKPRPAYVLLRGDFLQRGEQVGRAVPAMFPSLPKGEPNNRLGLARWLVQPDHPLTARVTVNRLWAMMFGQGIVRSLGDFGTQGDYPSHPELLDWLASEFVRIGWDNKALLKKIALSATYRQSSAMPNGINNVDPNNRLLHRSPRTRLSAEEIRDGALEIAGLLSPKIGGPSVMPYQPPDFFKGKYEGWTWILSTGEDQYRRGIYTFWRRTSLHPMFTIFDAPSREECVVARPRTNTPLQALVTLNDPTFVEAARVFAQRILVEGPTDLEGRVKFAFRAALARAPTAAEIRALRGRYQHYLGQFRENREEASKLINVGMAPRPANLDIAEHAAWTALANILLNLDETIMRE